MTRATFILSVHDRLANLVLLFFIIYVTNACNASETTDNLPIDHAVPVLCAAVAPHLRELSDGNI